METLSSIFYLEYGQKLLGDEILGYFFPIQFYSQVSNKVFVEDIKLQVLQKSQS